MQNRPPTPESIKRILRQESGFGCCICGNPIIQYHHIVPWEIDEHFRSEDMMCLCPNHHDEATKDALTEKEQRKFKSYPINIKKGKIQGNLKINDQIPVLDVGSNQFAGEGDFFVIDSESLLGLRVSDGQLSITIKLYNEKDELLVHIIDNEWIIGDPKPWDIEADYQLLKIRNKKRDIALQVNTKNTPIIVKANLWKRGSTFAINDKGIFYNGVVQDVSFHNLCFVGLRFVVDTKNKKFSLQLDPCLGKKGAGIISWPVLNERIARGIEFWEKLIKTSIVS